MLKTIYSLGSSLMGNDIVAITDVSSAVAVAGLNTTLAPVGKSAAVNTVTSEKPKKVL